MPLDIQGATDKGKLTSYKEPWRQERCVQSIGTTGMYEAGANLLWVDPGLANCEVPSEVTTWSTVHRLCEQFFSWDSATVHEHGSEAVRGTRRIIFPLTLEAYVPKADTVTCACHFNGALSLVGGHAVVLSWYLGMWQAVGSGNVAWAKLLWQCGLTVTVQVRICSAAEAVLQSLAFSEKMKAQEATLSDSFLTFSKKVNALGKGDGPKSAAALADNGVRYHGTLYSAGMHKAVQLINTFIGEDEERLLRNIEQKFGREVLTASYTKIMRLLQQTQKSADNGPTVQGLVKFLLETLLCGLVRGSIVPRNFTLDFMEQRKAGSPGWIHLTLARQQASRAHGCCAPAMPARELAATRGALLRSRPPALSPQCPTARPSTSSSRSSRM